MSNEWAKGIAAAAAIKGLQEDDPKALALAGVIGAATVIGELDRQADLREKEAAEREREREERKARKRAKLDEKERLEKITKSILDDLEQRTAFAEVVNAVKKI